MLSGHKPSVQASVQPVSIALNLFLAAADHLAEPLWDTTQIRQS